MSLNLAVSLILASMQKEYDSFVQNYNMHGMGMTINELHAMLKLHEENLPKKDAPALHAVRAGKVFSIWKAFGRNTRDLGSFGKETDETTDLHQHLSRLCSQRLEMASQITCDAVTIHTKTASQDLKTASECTT
ncbi:hypothetical protein Tco_0837124 [Tanacetum coccineum]